MGRRTLLLITSILVAAVGTALIGLYVKGAENRAIANTATREVLVAQVEIPAGADPGPDSYKVEGRRVGDLSADALTAGSQIRGRTLGPVYPGQVLQAAMFGLSGAGIDNGIRPGQLGITVELADPQRAAGLLKLGSSIDIFALTAGAGGAKRSSRLLSDVTVIQIGGRQLGSAAGTSTDTDAEDVPSTLVGLTLSEADVRKIKDAEANGSLYFAVRPGSAS